MLVVPHGKKSREVPRGASFEGEEGEGVAVEALKWRDAVAKEGARRDALRASEAVWRRRRCLAAKARKWRKGLRVLKEVNGARAKEAMGTKTALRA